MREPSSVSFRLRDFERLLAFSFGELQGILSAEAGAHTVVQKGGWVWHAFCLSCLSGIVSEVSSGNTPGKQDVRYLMGEESEMEDRDVSRQEHPVDSAPAGKPGLSYWERLIQQAKQAADTAPEVREDRVAAVKRALQNGTLNLNGKDLAEKLLGEILRDSERGI
jgi:flagellar biosynthesis anti-sigma factor FlgM